MDECEISFNDLAQMLCQMEGKKHSVNIADMKEILKCLRSLIQLYPIEVLKVLLK